MRRIIAGLVLGMLVWTGVAAAAPASTDAAAQKIGIIDINMVIEQSQAGKDANAQIAALAKVKQAALDPLQQKVQDLSKALNAKDAKLSDQARKDKQAALSDAQDKYRKAVAAAQAAIKQKAQTLHDQVVNQIGAVLKQVGDSEGFTAILDVSSAAYYKRAVDVTWEVIRKYDALYASAQSQASSTGQSSANQSTDSSTDNGS